MNKKIIIAVLVIVVILVLWWLLGTPAYTPTVPTSGTPSASDKVSSINQDLQSVDLGSVDSEFQPVNQDVSSL